ncbi:Uncharacterised protein [Streptococcus pneumoniae]|nr:Uncharacterised protein [Streptococcus pneumoniae]
MKIIITKGYIKILWYQHNSQGIKPNILLKDKLNIDAYNAITHDICNRYLIIKLNIISSPILLLSCYLFYLNQMDWS